MGFTHPFLQPLAKRPVSKPLALGAKGTVRPLKVLSLMTTQTRDFSQSHQMRCLWHNQNGSKTMGIQREYGNCICQIERKHISCYILGARGGRQSLLFQN